MGPFMEMSLIGIDRCRKDHQICSTHTLLRIGHVSIDRAQSDRCLEILDSTADADYVISQRLPPEDHPE